ncbi:MAG: helix-turn-helix domain-containing protein, partial [Syntrophomonas sp.]
KRALPGISPNTLSMRLQELEKAGIISKKVYPEVPPRVEYSYTTRGQELGVALIPLIQWTLDNYENSESEDAREIMNRCINKSCGQ